MIGGSGYWGTMGTADLMRSPRCLTLLNWWLAAVNTPSYHDTAVRIPHAYPSLTPPPHTHTLSLCLSFYLFLSLSLYLSLSLTLSFVLSLYLSFFLSLSSCARLLFWGIVAGRLLAFLLAAAKHAVPWKCLIVRTYNTLLGSLDVCCMHCHWGPEQVQAAVNRYLDFLVHNSTTGASFSSVQLATRVWCVRAVAGPIRVLAPCGPMRLFARVWQIVTPRVISMV